jgi:outer membrane beta-barrel protein
MESRIQHFLIAALLLTPGLGVAATDPGDLDLEPLVVREPERREIKVDKIDSENIEIGGFAGIMNVEDFGTDTLYGLRVAYHVTEDLFVEAVYGETELGETSFERLSGNIQILPDGDRDMSYYNLSVGFNVFPGEAFVGRGLAFKGGLYVIGGAGSTDFAGDEHFTVNFGVGYRLAATDWLALRIDVRDHMFETDLLGSEELTHNVEFSGGLTVFF